MSLKGFLMSLTTILLFQQTKFNVYVYKAKSNSLEFVLNFKYGLVPTSSERGGGKLCSRIRGEGLKD